ncbi:unnamed protein product, partial [Arabidopsis halleri]
VYFFVYLRRKKNLKSMCNIFMEEEGTLAREEDGLKPEAYDLYFKGFVRKD